jgi:hypothetical protein
MLATEPTEVGSGTSVIEDNDMTKRVDRVYRIDRASDQGQPATDEDKAWLTEQVKELHLYRVREALKSRARWQDKTFDDESLAA